MNCASTTPCPANCRPCTIGSPTIPCSYSRSMALTTSPTGPRTSAPATAWCICSGILTLERGKGLDRVSGRPGMAAGTSGIGKEWASGAGESPLLSCASRPIHRDSKPAPIATVTRRASGDRTREYGTSALSLRAPIARLCIDPILGEAVQVVTCSIFGSPSRHDRRTR